MERLKRLVLFSQFYYFIAYELNFTAFGDFIKL